MSGRLVASSAVAARRAARTHSRTQQLQHTGATSHEHACPHPQDPARHARYVSLRAVRLLRPCFPILLDPMVARHCRLSASVPSSSAGPLPTPPSQAGASHHPTTAEALLFGGLLDGQQCSTSIIVLIRDLGRPGGPSHPVTCELGEEEGEHSRPAGGDVNMADAHNGGGVSPIITQQGLAANQPGCLLGVDDSERAVALACSLDCSGVVQGVGGPEEGGREHVLAVNSAPFASAAGVGAMRAKPEAAEAVEAAAESDQPTAVMGAQLAALYELYLRCTQQDGSALSSLTFHDSQLSAGSVFFTSRPVTVGSATPLFQLIALGITPFFLYWAYSEISEALSGGVFRPPPRAVRLSVLGLRDASLSPAASNSLVFGLLHDSCAILPASNISNASFVVSPAALQPLANGYYLSIAAGGTAARDPVRWVVEAQADGSDRWSVVGASVWRGQGSLAAYFPQLAYLTPMAVSGSSVLVAVDGRPSWPWILCGGVSYSIASCGLMMSFIFAWVRKYWAVVWIMCSVFGSSSVLQLAAAAGFYARGDWRASAVASIYFAGNGVVTVMLLVNERLVLSGMLIFSVLFILALVVRHSIVYDDPDGLLAATFRSSGAVAFLFTSGLIAFHRWALHRSRQLVLADQARYDKAWTAILADPAEKAAVAALGQYVLERQAGCKTHPLQLNRACVPSIAPVAIFSSAEVRTGNQHGKVCSLLPALLNFSSSMSLGTLSSSTVRAGLLHCDLEGVLDQNSPVHSMDQLFCQAIALSPILITKVQCWAAVSGGYFCSAATARDAFRCSRNCRSGRFNAGVNANHDAMVDGHLPAGFVRWLDVAGKELQIGGQVRWAKVKSAQRSIEKSTRSGKGCSHLLDICRQSIYFKSIHDVLACLEAMNSDPEVIICRIKNRFDPGLHSVESAGYRNLAVNLRLDTGETRAMAVETHVCEVQLLVLRMAAIKNDEGHKKYILFRNMRGE